MQTLKRFFQISDVLDELLTGICLFGLLCQIAVLVFSGRRGYYSAGLWIGIALALLGGLHIAWSLDKALDLGEEGATKKMRAYSLLRYGVALVVLGLLMILDFASPLTAFLGLMGLKISAYLQPLLHRAALALGLKTEVAKPLLSPEEVDELIRRQRQEERGEPDKIAESK